jgi:transglutaminase-like putative cysteine protease
MWIGFGRTELVAPAMTVRRYPVSAGEGQIRDTLRYMVRVVRLGVVDPKIVAVAVNIVRDVDGHDLHALALRVREWVTSSVRFLPDPVMDGDYIRTPDYLLSEIQQYGIARGDCDDVAVLTATMGMAVGLFARFHAVAFSGRETYSHVWTDLLAGDTWMVVDPTATAVMPAVDRSLLVDI